MVKRGRWSPRPVGVLAAAVQVAAFALVLGCGLVAGGDEFEDEEHPCISSHRALLAMEWLADEQCLIGPVIAACGDEVIGTLADDGSRLCALREGDGAMVRVDSAQRHAVLLQKAGWTECAPEDADLVVAAPDCSDVR